MRNVETVSFHKDFAITDNGGIRYTDRSQIELTLVVQTWDTQLPISEMPLTCTEKLTINAGESEEEALAKMLRAAAARIQPKKRTET